MSDEAIRKINSAHRSILETIDRLQLNLRNYPQAKPLIRELHQKLLAHFGQQNESLLAPLKDYYSGHRNEAKMIEFLEFDLKEIKIKLLVFYDQHSGELEDTNSRSFPGDFNDFSGFIMGRIKMEADYLIPLLGKLPG